MLRVYIGLTGTPTVHDMKSTHNLSQLSSEVKEGKIILDKARGENVYSFIIGPSKVLRLPDQNFKLSQVIAQVC